MACQRKNSSMINHWLINTFDTAMRSALNGDICVPVPFFLSHVERSCLIDFIAWQLNKTTDDIKVVNAITSVLPELRHKDDELAIGVSGGIDSTIAAYYAKMVYSAQNPLLINTRFGNPYREAEDYCLNQLFDGDYLSYTVNDDSLDASKFPQGYIIPLRNSLIASVLALYSNNCWIIANYRKAGAGEEENSGVSDKSPKFFCRISELLSLLYHRPTHVTSPFLHLSKADTIKWFQDSRFDAIDILHKTITCYSPVKRNDDWVSCGCCYACWKKAKALDKLGILSSFYWDRDPLNNPAAHEYEIREKNKGR